MTDGSALRLTTAKYYTPSHKVIHEHGISPDIAVDMSDEEERDMILRRTPGGVESLDEPDRQRAVRTRDAQMDRAMDLLKGITLFSQRAAADDHRIAAGDKSSSKP